MNILITAIGSFSAEAVIESLKKLNNRVIGCDIYPKEWHYIVKKLDNFYRVPLAINEEEYISRIIEICKLEKIELIFPLIDIEIDIFNKNRKKIEKIETKVCIQSEKALEIARDKFKLFKKFLNSDVQVIPTYLYQEIEKLKKFPYIAKPKNGRSSEGLFKIEQEKDFQLIENPDNYIIQDYYKGNIIVVDYIRNSKTKQDFSIIRKELIRTKNGAGITVEIFENEKISKLSSYIGNELNIIGCICMEFIERNNEYYIMDINPRFSAGIAFTQKSGYDIVKNHLNCFLNKKIDEPIQIKNNIMTKRYIEEII